MYENGTGVAQDFVQAVKWYRLAADQNKAIAQGNLGYMYANGRGGPQNFIQAYVWFTLAASRFPPSDREKRDLMVENRNAIAAQMTAAQIAEAQRLARNWKPK
jgi:TPR repeat protein